MGSRIFLVDDEQPVLEGLSATIRKFFPETEICGTAKSGRDAVVGVSREKPDIVLMDVRMPGMSGLDALRELRRLAPDTLPILLTAFERFDIAKEAFSLGVYDYLVKPVEQETLVKALRGALERHAERKEAALRACAARNELELAIPLLEEGFIYTLILGDADGDTLRSYASRLGLARISGVMAVVGRPRRNFPELRMERREALALRAEMEYRTRCVVGAPMGDFLPVFFPGPDAADAEKALRDALAAMREPGLLAAVGSAREGSGLRLSWAEATSALASDPEGKNGSGENSAAAALACAQGADIASTLGAFRIFSSGASGVGETAALAGAVASAYGADGRAIIAVGRELESAADETGRLDASRCAAALGSALTKIGIDGEDTERGVDRDRRVRIALAFIAESLASPISLDDAAARVGLSAARLSRLLVAQTGKPFMDHLTEARFRRAREELESGGRSIKEIAADCGYPDANYFSRAFKKIVGLTPSEYANRHGRSIV